MVAAMQKFVNLHACSAAFSDDNHPLGRPGPWLESVARVADWEWMQDGPGVHFQFLQYAERAGETSLKASYRWGIV